jgi:hypothetical protein
LQILENFKNTAEALRAQSKPILDINELSKRILGTAIEVLNIKRETTVVYLPFKILAYFAPLRLETTSDFSFKD